MAMMIAMAAAVAFASPATAQDPSGQQPPRQSDKSAASGGAEFNTVPPADQPVVPGSVAKIVHGVAYAPADAPSAVQQMIWAANSIIGKPYVYGGGHAKFEDTGYDCSGTVSYALHGAGLLQTPRDSSDFFTYGSGGRGAWVTIYTRSSHAYMTVAGIRLDTSAADDPGGKSGPRWRPLRRSNGGYKARHPTGL
jgi:cell wall-associated NlpC family hydrolase